MRVTIFAVFVWFMAVLTSALAVGPDASVRSRAGRPHEPAAWPCEHALTLARGSW